MGIKSDRWITEMAETKGMIEPFSPKQIRHGISFGVSSYGYDFRISYKFKIFTPSNHETIDPKANHSHLFTDFEGETCTLPPHSYCLTQSLEYFRIPRDIIAICFGKSTYARCGIIINVTPFEPEWEGYATIAIINTTPCPAKIYAGEGIGQVIFLEASELCKISYADKKGKYQAQHDITFAKGTG